MANMCHSVKCLFITQHQNAPAVRRCLIRACYINHVGHDGETTLGDYKEAEEITEHKKLK